MQTQSGLTIWWLVPYEHSLAQYIVHCFWTICSSVWHSIFNFFSYLQPLCLYSPLQNNGEEKQVAALNIMKISLLGRGRKVSSVLRGLATDRRKDGAIGLKCQYIMGVHLAIRNEKDPSSTCIL